MAKYSKYDSKSDPHNCKNGVRSPMNSYRQNEDFRNPSTAGTTEVLHGSAPKKAAPVRSPTRSKASGELK